ncbi:MAG: hypothetical protein IT243_10735 [Bacteroidia bacterium]|nr:hypothetical protein [Bacteroidia bacterium]
MGRDALFDLLASYKLLIRRRKRMIKTTQSHHWLKKYPNLIKGYIPIQSNEIYVSDITYWKIETGYIYISLITDAYSHKIVGYDVSESLESECHLKITHHSDR